ncbi:hypothetical protein D3C81_1563560 [compost metagenome]
MTHIAGVPTGTCNQLAVHIDPGTNSCADRDKYEMLLILSGAQPLLSQSCSGSIVLQLDRIGKMTLQFMNQREVTPAWQVGRAGNLSVTCIQRPWSPYADTCNLLARDAALMDKSQNSLSDSVYHNIWGYGWIRGYGRFLNYISVSGDDANGCLRTPDIDPDCILHM